MKKDNYEMEFEVGKQCKWEDIKVGEVFAVNSCWCVLYKSTKDKALLLGHDWEECLPETGNERYFCAGKVWAVEDFYYKEDLYKLPESVQALWRTE